MTELGPSWPPGPKLTAVLFGFQVPCVFFSPPISMQSSPGPPPWPGPARPLGELGCGVGTAWNTAAPATPKLVEVPFAVALTRGPSLRGALGSSPLLLSMIISLVRLMDKIVSNYPVEGPIMRLTFAGES